MTLAARRKVAEWEDSGPGELRAGPLLSLIDCAARRGTTARLLAEACLPLEPRLRAWIARRGVAPADVDDVVQDVYLRVLKADPGDDVRNWFGYLSRAAWSEIVERQRHAACVRIEPVEGQVLAAFADPSPGAVEAAEARERLARVAAAMDTLSEKRRLVVLLRRLDEVSLKETAAAMELSQSAIEKHLRAALAVLAEADPDPHRPRKWRRASAAENS
ncbi:sigma-70 family RNA polymerase sigma factor [Sphingomonas sp.]|uniref:sigma-70 family RNA polymerase sigma factor n=1 Tax=Sphingomonas sp. TaxID=28214 RepID=UPI0025F9BE26|nr:sigma-70 family RNA polymerase sigma factor [Sphingomonas sp.]